jgi:hypothetical protein
MLTADYQRAVQLLLRLVPPVFATEAFALKGGTAINLFMAPVSRLSVDLDLVFLPLVLSRDEALAAISNELHGVRERATSIGLSVRAPRRITGDDTQLLVSDGQVEVKIEVNQIFRGSVLPPRRSMPAKPLRRSTGSTRAICSTSGYAIKKAATPATISMYLPSTSPVTIVRHARYWQAATSRLQISTPLH